MNIITYPARPLNGGPLNRAVPLLGKWAFEPKVNGWRTLVHVPTSFMWNRHGEPLTIRDEFRHVLDDLSPYLPCGIEWLDCEAFNRRHPLGKGSLVILDAVVPGLTWEQRQQLIYDNLIRRGAVMPWPVEQIVPPANRLLSFSYNYTWEDDDPLMRPDAAWVRLQHLNQRHGCELFEGLVAKRLDSVYPIQLRSPTAETRHWVKHRWHF